MKIIKLGNLQFQPKSKIKAGEGKLSGIYKFFTSSSIKKKFIDEYNFIGPALIFGTGGSASIHYCDEKFSTSTDCFILKTENKEINLKYIYYYLFGNIYILEQGFKGAGLKHISKEYLKDLDFPLLSLQTQKEIVNKLDKLSELISLRKESIKKQEELTKSIFIEMFGDPMLNEKGWVLKTIKDLVTKDRYSIKRGPFGGALKKEIFVDNGYLVYEQFHALNNDFSFARYFIDENKFNELKAFEVSAGDIIISCSGVYLGKLAIIPDNYKKGIINQALLKLTLDNEKINKIFFYYIFTNKNFKNKYFGIGIGSGIPNFPPMEEFKKFNFISPPISLQNEFAEIVKKNEENIKRQKESLEKLEELYNASMQESFRF